MNAKMGTLVVMISLVVLAGTAGPAFAETALTGVVVGDGHMPYSDKSCGWEFTPTENIKITKLGVWAIASATKLYNNHIVRIYDPSSYDPSNPVGVIEATVPAGDLVVNGVDVRENGYVYVDVAAQNVVLSAGKTYVIASYWMYAGVAYDRDVQQASPGFSPGSGIALGQVDLRSAGKVMPADVGATFNTFLSPNFQFEPANAAPVAANDTALTQMDTPVTVDVLANDSDADSDALSITSYAQGANGTVAAAAGGLTYTPNAGFFGTDSFTYTIADPKGAAATATVTVTVNKAPVAAPDPAQTEVGVAITVAVLTNDHDDDGDALAVILVGAAANGSVTLNSGGTVTYTPNAGFTGQDQFLYTISDGKGGTSSAEVLVTVNPKDVLIDIKPGSYPNSINLGSNGVVPVAILSTADFDATTVDPETVTLAGARVAVRGKGNRLMASNQDVNADGRLDLVLQVETENLNPDDLQDGSATVMGTTTDGIPIIGTDEITIVPQ